MPIRFFNLMLLLIVTSACRRDGELSDTLAWMDNTYNPHDGVSRGFGHGRTGWYAPTNSGGEAGEYLVYGSTETFTYNRCRMTLHVQDNPAASAHREMYGAFVSAFNLGDVNPQSIKISTYSHSGGFRCEEAKPEDQQPYKMNCDHAEITFATRSEAPLIDEESHTTYPNLQGTDHETKGKSRASRGFFEVDDVEYAGRFAKAFRHAVELRGGKPEAF
jgi:hypothetical protein